MYILKFPQKLSRVPFPHDFMNVMVSWMDPYSCVLFSMCSAYADLGLLILIYLLYSGNLDLETVLSGLCMISHKFGVSVSKQQFFVYILRLCTCV
jgi:hypothetical protein